MSDRAPDNQPTENIRTILSSEKSTLAYWEQSKDLNARALTKAIYGAVKSRKSVAQWEARLTTRLAEEAAKGVEVTGL